MHVTVEYTSQLKRAAGVSAESVEVPDDCTLEELFRLVSVRHGDDVRRLLFDAQGRFQESILLFIGDQQVHWQPSLELSEGQVVTLVSPISGG